MLAFQKQLAVLLMAQEFLGHTLTNSFEFQDTFSREV